MDRRFVFLNKMYVINTQTQNYSECLPISQHKLYINISDDFIEYSDMKNWVFASRDIWQGCKVAVHEKRRV